MTQDGGNISLELRRYLTWAGVYLPIETGICDYRIEFDARLLAPDHTMAEGEGWGFGVGPCNVWTEGGPVGFALQYAVYQGNHGPTANPGWFVNPDVNNGHPVDMAVDYDRHHWSVVVRDNRANFSLDFAGAGTAIGPFDVAGVDGLPADCHDRGIVLRVFNAAAEFNDIAIVAL